MTYALGKPIVVGRFTIAIVSRQALDACRVGRNGAALLGHKEPVYVVVRDGRGKAMLDMTGAKVAQAKVEALCPAVAYL